MIIVGHVIAVILTISFTACENADENLVNNKNKILNIDSITFKDTQKEYLYNLFKTEYLWYDKVADVNYSVYDTPTEMINDLRYSQYDQWSYYETLEHYHNRSAQINQGFGCYYGDDNYIYDMKYGSPCEKAGLKRGDFVLKINDNTASQDVYYKTENILNQTSKFQVQRNSVNLDISITASNFEYKSTFYQMIENINSLKIGHLIFNEFTEQSALEIEDAFIYFKENKVDELIVDLRYNRGGNMITTSILMDKIAGYCNDESLQFHLKSNQNYRDKDEYYYFTKDDNSLNLERIYFLTSQRTASASETVINSLKPYMDVVLIGKKTYGKPNAMKGRVKDESIYWLINSSVYNVNNEGDFYDGINVDCIIDDSLTYSRKDLNDSLFNTAMFHIKNGLCPSR